MLLYFIFLECAPAGGAFHCDNGQCLSRSVVCDDVRDCVDGSDEEACGKLQVHCDMSQHYCSVGGRGGGGGGGVFSTWIIKGY